MSQTTNDTALGGAFGGDDEGLVQTNPEVEASQNPTTTKTITDENALGGSFGSEESPLAQSLSGEAQSSADAAQASEEAALASQQAAATSEANAATSESNAAQSSTEASTSATNAATSETNAATSAATATTKANEASASATQAATSATNAATSETNAATSEANAAQSELDAEASATSSTASALASQSSATSASSSASAASTSATNAATSETNAATSATEASGSATDAANSATSASTSATNAANSATSASTSETNASASATSAATSATNAATSETNASTSATNAATSETNAATSATNASTSEINAATSEANAATSATSAATSATNSATSETNAATSAATATSKASEAATSEANAATSATNAATSETNAATSATSASTSETNAATSETNAATSETNASASATSASNSATAAATSETNAATSATSAETAKVDAETAETNAATSATNAATSETNAATSATNAATSATESATSATASATSATASATSATESATSASNAAVSEANAIGGASDAAVSATQAAGSATSASNSANAASTSETNAANSASAASTSEANAATSEANAATSATNASTSASTATTKASEASTSASNAASSETAAASSATAAASSATSAANSASNASASATSASNTLDQFEDIYLGAKASNPTLDNDGDALQVGALYFNTTDNDLRIWEGSAWTNVVVSSDIQAQIDTSIANLVDSAPTALDTLNELAAALGDDPNFAATVNNALGSLQNQITTLDNNKYEEGDSASFSDVSLDNMFGPISYDSNEGTLSFPISDSTTIHLGHEMAYMVKNTSGVSINKGDILAITGTDSGTVTVAKYLADGTFLAGQVVGIANETILNNETGYALTQGHVVGIDTSSYVEGAFLYASPTVAGGLTNVPPVSPNIKVIVGMCTVSDATNGEIVSRITFSQNASETNYSNTTSGLVASNVQGALDELQQNKASVDLLSSNINLFPTTAASTITGYNRLVTDKTDSDYNTTAVAVATGPIGLTETNVGQLASDAGLIDGSIAGITVTLIGNIEKTVGNSNQGAHFYFKIFRRESDGTEHEMGESNRTSVIYETDGYEQFSASVYLNDGGLSTFSSTDRVVLKFYGVSISGDPEYNFQFGGQAPIRCLVPVPVSVIPTSSAEETPVTVTSFNGILGSSDTNVQAALDTIDDHNHNTDYAPLAGYNSTNWNTAYGWGDHSTVGYLTSIPSEYLTQAEGDVRYLSIDATTLPDQTGHSGQFLTTNGTTADWATVDTSLGDTAYGWGDHSLAGYSTTDTTYSIGDGGLTEKNFTTGLKTKLDGIATNANNYVLPFTNNSANWNTAYGWGDHALAGYLTSLPSHNHNDLYYTESEADSRFVNTTGDTMTGTLTVPNLTIGSGNKIKFANNDYIRYDDGVNRFHFDVDGGTSNASVQASTFVGALSGNASTASRWSNARTNTVTLTGDASGSGSASVDGTGNWTVSVPVVVNNDSHTHDGRYYTESESDSRFVNVTGDTMTGALTMSGGTPVNLGDGNHYLKKISAGYSGVTIDGPQLQGHQGGELTTNYQGDKWALRWNTSQDVHIGRNLHISGNNAYLGNGTGQSYLRIGDQVTDDNAGGWNKGVHLNAQYHGRFRIRTSNYNYGALETYYWADSSVSPSMGIYGNTSVFRFTGSITNIRNKDNATFWHAGNDGSGSGLDADLLDGIDSTRFTKLTSQVSSGDFNTIFNTGTAFRTQISQVANITGGSYSNNPTGVYTYGSVLNWRAENSTFQLYTSHTGDLVYRTGWNNDGYSGWRRVLNTGYYGAAWTSGNDGSGSGLDADLLDGNHDTAFALAHSHPYVNESGDTMTGNLNFTTANTGLAFTNLNGIYAEGKKAFWSHNNGHITLSAAGTAGDLYLGYQSGSEYVTRNTLLCAGMYNYNRTVFMADHSTGTLYSRGQETWTDNRIIADRNIGANTNLDTDLEDGGTFKSYGSANTSWNAPFSYGGVVGFSFDTSIKGQIGFDIRHNTSDFGNLWFRTKNNTGYNGWAKVWHTLNDGSGSGLDADLLDGQHASAFAPASHSHSNYLTTTGKAADSNLLDGIDSSRVVYGDGSYKSRSTSTFHNNVSGFHFYSAATNAPTAEWYNWITCRGNSWGDSNEYSFQLAHNFWNNDLYGRRTQSGTEQGWYKIWHSLNDGSGSGLDADLLDGNHASAFATSGHGHTGLSSNGWGGITSSTSSGYIDFGPANTSHAHIYTDRPNFYFNKMIQVLGGTNINQSDVRSDIFYDKNNTGYYTDPASTSRTNLITTNKIHCVGSATNTAPRWDTSFHVAQSQHFYGHSAYGNIYVGESNDVQIRSTGIASSSFKAPIFYDSNDTSCFINPNSDSLFKGSLDIQENVSSPGYTFMEFLAYNTGGRLGSIYRQYGTMYYSTSSDYRLKENVVVLDNASEKLKLLKPKRFNFIDYPESTIDGFIAHEVEAIVPEAVIGEKDAVDRYGNPEYQSMDHSKLVPLLTAALQEALDKIEALETRLDVLENN
jgi:hypothetical protein